MSELGRPLRVPDTTGGDARFGQGFSVDFSLSAEQRELTEAATAFARRELNEDLVKREDAGEFPREAWRKCAEFGIQGLPIPAELGGADADVLTTALVMEALGYGCRDNGLVFSLGAQMWSVELPLVTFGTLAQQRAYLPGLVSGDLIGAHAMTEPDSGSDALHISTRAERRGDHYLLNGTKQHITNAPVADVLLVYAMDPDRPGLAGLSVFLVNTATPGIAVSSSFEKMGLRTSPMGEITLHDCLVPAQSRLGPEGAAMAIFNSSMEWERSCLFASIVGAMRRQLEACVRYARSREQFGQPIGKFQGVSSKLADMYVRLEAARSLIYRAAWMKQQGRSAPAEAAAAKLFTSEAWVRSSQDAIQIHGAWGYLKDAGIERDLRDAIAGTIYSGTSEIQRVVLARMLGLLVTWAGEASPAGRREREGYGASIAPAADRGSGAAAAAASGSV
jgi:alkylation response protein AidB-like acyl-CoA dehydrogenase